MSPYLLFLVTAAIVVVTASKLAEFGDIIAARTSFGGLLVGTVLLAGATSLPELIASVSSFQQGLPDLAAGSFLGSNMVNIVLLAIVDVLYYQVPLLRTVALTHTLTALLGIILTALAAVFMVANFDVAIGWVGVDSLVIIGFYFGGVWLIRQEGRATVAVSDKRAVVLAEDFPTLRRGVLGFLGAALVLVLVVPALVQASSDIAALTGIGATFVGTAMLSLITSLPELLAAWSAVRMGSPELAVGNLFGSSVFNMLGLGIADFFYVSGRFLGAIDPSFVLVALLGVLLTGMAMLGTLARLERRLLFIEVDALLIIVAYVAGMYMLFVRGIGG